jgi:hypothetical protein
MDFDTFQPITREGLAITSLAVAGSHRSRPLVVVATPDPYLAQELIDRAHRSGLSACVARSATGCLRVATAVGPDLVLLDARLPRRLETMLRSHPATATAGLVRVEARSGSAVSPQEALPLAPLEAGPVGV